MSFIFANKELFHSPIKKIYTPHLHKIQHRFPIILCSTSILETSYSPRRQTGYLVSTFIWMEINLERMDRVYTSEQVRISHSHATTISSCYAWWNNDFNYLICKWFQYFASIWKSRHLSRYPSLFHLNTAPGLITGCLIWISGSTVSMLQQ